MGKIAKSASEKHEATLSPAVSKFITTSTSIPLHQLPSHLRSFPRLWPFPRGDLYHWIPTLNRLDDILDDFNTTYGLTAGPQTSPFLRTLLLRGESTKDDENKSGGSSDAELDSLGFSKEGDEELILEILCFTQLVFENCGNRSLYASSSRLGDLLNTTSLPLLEGTLQLSLRLAERYSASRLRLAGPYLQGVHQTLLMQHYMIDLEKLEELAHAPMVPNTASELAKDMGKSGLSNQSSVDLLSMVRPDDDEQTLWHHYGSVSFELESKNPPGTVQPASQGLSDQDSIVPNTPTPIRRTQSYNVTRPRAGPADIEPGKITSTEKLDIPLDNISSTSVTALIAEYLPRVPPTLQFSFLQRLRVAKAFSESLGTRQSIVKIRLLAIANLSHIYPELMLNQKVLRQDVESPRRFQLPHQLCDLIHPPGHGTAMVPKGLQDVALETLEALTNHKNKSTDVCNELGVNVSHGVLSYVVRKAVSEAATDEESESEMVDRGWRDSLYSLINTLPKSSPRSPEGFLSSGLIDLLVEALNCRTAKAEIDQPRIISFLDSFVYQTSNGFTALVNARGLDAISSLLAYEVETAAQQEGEGKGMPIEYKTSVTDYRIPFFKQQALRALIRFLNHVMTFSGAPFDRVLRNLIESSHLLQGLRTIMMHPKMYGANVWSGAVTLFSSFIHNEPTSYAAIAEAGLTKAFLETITQRPLTDQSPSTAETASTNGEVRANEGGTEGVDFGPDGTSGPTGQPEVPFLVAGTVPFGVLPNAECIAALPQAFSAICLNESGMQQFENSKALEVFFKALFSKMHVKALSNASGTEVESLGRDIDELARHHPRLKPAIIGFTSMTAGSIARVLQSQPVIQTFGPKLYYSDSEGNLVINGGIRVQAKPWNHASLLGISQNQSAEAMELSASEDIEMTDAPVPPTTDEAQVPTAQAAANITAAEVARNQSPVVAEFVTVFSRFLLGFFNNPSMCTTFCEGNGVERLLDVAYAPSLPWDFHSRFSTSKSLRTIHALVDAKPHLTLPSVLRRTQEALKDLEVFIEHDDSSSFFTPFIVPEKSPEFATSENVRRSDGARTVACLRALVVVQTTCLLLSQLFASHHNRSTSHPYSMVNLTDMYSQIITTLGKVHRKCIWDGPMLISLRHGADDKSRPVVDTSTSVVPDDSNSSDTGPPNGQVVPDQQGSSSSSSLPPFEPQAHNFRTVIYLLKNIPPAISKFYGAIGRAILFRRLPNDAYQRGNVRYLGEKLADALLEQLRFCVERPIGYEHWRDYTRTAVDRLTEVLIDPKPDTDRPLPQLLTIIAHPFKAKGGLLLLGQLVQALYAEVVAQNKPLGFELQYAESARILNNILLFYSSITDNRIVLEGVQTVALASRVEQRNGPEYFSIHQFMVEIRAQVLDAVLPIWISSEIPTSEFVLVQRLSMVMQHILESTGENGALKKSDPAPSRTKYNKVQWKVRQSTDFERLLDKGYVPDLAREALYRCNDAYAVAQEYCAAYKRNPSLPRYPAPPEDVATPATVDASQGRSSLSGSSDLNEAVADSPNVASGTMGDRPAVTSIGPNSQDPLRAIAEGVLRDHMSNPRFAESPSQSPSRNSSRDDANQARAGDVTDVITIEDLDEKRNGIREQLMERCLTILDSFPNLTFEIAELLVGAASKAPNSTDMRQEVTSTLVESLISYSAAENLQENGKKVAAVAHLLGIILREKEFFAAAQEELKDSFAALLVFLAVRHDEKPEDSAPWIPQVLLILEHILAEDAQPRQIRWEPPSADQTNNNQQVGQLVEPFIAQEDKHALFDRLMEVIPRIGKNSALGNAVIRILVVLTRDRALAVKMGQKQSLQRLFLTVKQLSTAKDKDTKFHNRVLLILRHVIEDDDTIRQIMRADIQATFEKQSPARPMDTTTYTRNMYYLVLRAPELFIEVTNELLELKDFNRNQSPQVLQLKKVEKASAINQDTEAVQDTEMSGSAVVASDGVAVDPPQIVQKEKPANTKPPIVEHADGVVHFLLSELLAYKDVEDKEIPTIHADASEQNGGSSVNMGDVEMGSAETTATNNDSPPVGAEAKKSDDKPPFNPEDHVIFMYRTFILQCLTELLQGYTRSKVDFINYSRKGDGLAMTPSKPRSGALNYFLNYLMPTGIIKHAEDVAEKKKSSTSGWAISVLVALCSRTEEKGPSKLRDAAAGPEDEPDLLLVRRFVLEHALKAFRDAVASADNAEMKYSRLLTMADLFDRMLAGRPAAVPGHRRSNEGPDDNLVPTQKQVAKIMFEKNFITALTHSLSEVDLKIPHASRVVKYLLRPLKLLTYTAVELSLSSDESTTPGQTDEDEISSATSGSEEAGGDREETPDFYRNSTLGMFEPGREDEPSSGSENEDEDEDMYGEEYADDMDYEEEEIGHDDEVVSDEEMDIDGIDGGEGMGPIEGLSGDMGMSVAIDIDEDDEDDDDDDDDEMDSDSDDDDSEDVGDEEDEEDEIEIMEEAIGEDGMAEHGEDGEWHDEDDDDMGFTHRETEVVLDMGMMGEGPQPTGGQLDSESGDDAEEAQHYRNAADLDPLMGDAGAVEIEDDAAIDEGSDHEEDDEEDEYEDGALLYGGPSYATLEEDEASLPFFMQGFPPRRAFQDHILHAGELGYRSHRLRADRPARADDDGLNPLLDRAGLRDTATPTGPTPARSLPPWFHATVDMLGGDRGFAAAGPGGDEAMEALRTIAANHPSIPDLQQLIDAMSHNRTHHPHGHQHPPHLHSIQFTVGGVAVGGPGGLPRIREIHPHRHIHAQTRLITSFTDPVSAIVFNPAGTLERWQEEVRMIFGAAYTEKTQRVINSILQLLVPPAIEADLKKKMLEAAEKVRKLEEERQRRDAEEEAKRKKAEEERQAAAKKAEEEAAAALARAAEMVSDPMQADTAEDAMEGVETSEVQPATDAAILEQTPRIMTSVRGRQVDITHLGIDLDFLHALPEELQEEVIMNRYAEQRSAAAEAGEEAAEVDQEFLEALPPDVREEVLAQEAEDRRRREREEARRRSQAAGAPPRADDIDPASFMASLDPILRQSVLADIADTEDDSLAQLPPDLLAEARALGGHHRRRVAELVPSIGAMERYAELRRHRHRDPAERTIEQKAVRRPIVQMLDKAGIATLLRLMFVAVPASSRNSLNGILRNACGNHQTRGEVVSGLLSILQDGTADAVAMERNFSQLTLRAKQSSVSKTPQSAKKPGSAVTALDSSEVSPLVVVGHCLSALVFLTTSIARLPIFFLTEHELFGSTKGKAKAKGKGKESKAGRYPINALLTLLERETIIESPHVMEQLASLLQVVSQPLIALLKKDKEDTPPTVLMDPESLRSAQVTEQAASESIPNADPPAILPMDSASETAAPVPTTATADTSSTANATTAQQNDDSKTQESKKTLVAPEIPEEHLRLIVNIFTARECSGKTFRDTLSTMNNLSSVSSAKRVFGQELVGRARELGKSIQFNLAQLIKALQDAETEMEAQSLALANFSPAGSDQAKLSRILTALDYLFDVRSESNRDSSNSEPRGVNESDDDLLKSLYEDPGFNALWQQLSDCLSATQQAEKYFLNVATILLPLIESLMVVCKRLSTKESRAFPPKGSVPTTPAPEPALRTIFFTFTNQHKKILNDLVRNNPKLMSGTFSVLVKNSTVLEFDNKRNYFTRKLHHRTVDMRSFAHPSLQLNVRRDRVFHDSFGALYFKKPEEIKYGKLNIRFVGEEGVDAGGVSREWFQVLARQMFNADYALFVPVASDRTTFHPSPLSYVNDDHLRYFHFIGRVIGKALYENRLLDCHFSRAVYKRMLGKAVTMKDMETIDLDYTKSLQWMLDNDITDVITETFSTSKETFGVTETVDLMPNGRNIPVTEENKHDYVRLIIADRLTGSIQDQLEHFLKGFHDIVPADLISIFDEGELELLISGMPEVDVDDWKNNTEYHNYNTTSPQIQWFWRAVRSFDKEERAKLLQFVTGTGKVPLNGFKELEGMNGFTKFSIHRDYGNKDRLPSSHTCFNQLDLPEYDNYEILRKNLYTAMTTGGEYFGFA